MSRPEVYQMLAALIAASVIPVCIAAARRALIPVLTPAMLTAVTFPNRTPVVIAVSSRLPRWRQNIVVVRRAAVVPHDLILARDEALEPTLLARALVTLLASRGHLGRIPTCDAAIPVEKGSAEPLPRVGEAELWIKSLRALKPLRIPGIGVVRCIMVHPPDDEIPGDGPAVSTGLAAQL